MARHIIRRMGPVVAFDERHAKQVAGGAIGMHIGSGPETAESGGPQEPQIFLVDNKDIAVGKEQ